METPPSVFVTLMLQLLKEKGESMGLNEIIAKVRDLDYEEALSILDNFLDEFLSRQTDDPPRLWDEMVETMATAAFRAAEDDVDNETMMAGLKFLASRVERLEQRG